MHNGNRNGYAKMLIAVFVGAMSLMCFWLYLALVVKP
jgi:hypothetical protein